MQHQEFKRQFLEKCAAAGLDEEETLALAKEARRLLAECRQTKTAGIESIPVVGGALAGLMGGAFELGKKSPYLLTTGTILSALGAGGAAGYGLAKARSLNDEDPQEVKTRETIMALRQATQRAEMQRRLSQQHAKARPRRPLTM